MCVDGGRAHGAGVRRGARETPWQRDKSSVMPCATRRVASSCATRAWVDTQRLAASHAGGAWEGLRARCGDCTAAGGVRRRWGESNDIT